MNKQSEIIKILSKELDNHRDCPAELYDPHWCTAERCDEINGESCKCWVAWSAEQIKENDK